MAKGAGRHNNAVGGVARDNMARGGARAANEIGRHTAPADNPDSFTPIAEPVRASGIHADEVALNQIADRAPSNEQTRNAVPGQDVAGGGIRAADPAHHGLTQLNFVV